MQNALIALVNEDESELRAADSGLRSDTSAAAGSFSNDLKSNALFGGAFAGKDKAKPELSAALDAVARAADLIRSAQERTQQAEERAARFADHAAEQISAAEERARQAQAQARAA